MKRGIDLSKHNWAGKRPVDFAKVREAGAEFVLLRAGYGSYPGQKDPYFDDGFRQATQAGLAVGAYWYSYAVTEAEALREADQCLEALAGKCLPMGVWFDQEYEPGILALTRAQRTAIVKAFCTKLRKAGWLCGLYCSRDWINHRLNARDLAGTELWVAAYTGQAGPGRTELPWGIWQTAGSSGRWPGVDGPCDLDVACKDYPALVRHLGLCGCGKAEDPQPPAPPAEQPGFVALPDGGGPDGPLARLTGLTGRDLAAAAQMITAMGGRLGAGQ